MRRFHWKFNASIGEIVVWLLVVSLAALLGIVMGRWALKRIHKTETGTMGKGAVALALDRLAPIIESGQVSRKGEFTPENSRKPMPAVYGELPLSFEPNQGQAQSFVKFLSRNSNHSLFLTPDEAVIQLPLLGLESPRNLPEKKMNLARSPQFVAWTQLRIRFLGASHAVEIQGERELPSKSNYLAGADPRNWRRNVPNFAQVHYRGIYPGIDLTFYGTQRHLEYDLIVKPGADPRQVTLSFAETETRLTPSSPKVDISTGDLVLQTLSGEVRQRRPLAYQVVNGKREAVACRYVMKGQQKVGFQVGDYDPSSSLVIDPVLIYSAVGIGGNAIAVDSSGNAYVAGVAGPGFLTTPGAFQGVPGGGDCVIGPNRVPCADILVAKLNPAGTDLMFSTFLGGNGADYCYGLAVDISGNVYLSGITSSGNFPTTPGAFQTSAPACTSGSPCYGAFVTKLDPSGTGLIYSSYLSGKSGGISGNGIAVDPVGCAYVTGDTGNGGFLTKLDAAGTAPVYSVPGIGGAGIALDLDGNAYVVGRNGGVSYITKVNADASAIVYSYHLGGSFPQYSLPPGEIEGITGIAVDLQGNAYVTGYTAYSNFPTTTNAPFPAAPGVGLCGFPRPTSFCRDAFVSKLNPEGTGLVYSTYLGGNSVDYGTAIAVDLSGNAYVTGVTRSTDFPVIPGSVSNQNGGIFVSKLKADGTTFLYSWTLGTRQAAEAGNAIAVDPIGNAYITGTAGSDFPLTSGAYQPPVGGNGSFVVKLFDEMTLFVPIVLSSSGLNNTFYSSELALTNRGHSDVKVEYTYTAAFGEGSGKAVDTLRAGQQEIITNTISYLRNLGLPLAEGENHGGTLRVHFTGLGSPSEGAAIVRTSTKVAVGRAGLAYPGVLQTLEEPSYLCGLRQNGSDRTNVAIQNAGTDLQGSVTLRLEIYSSDPGIPEVISPVVLEETLAPGEFKQITGILSSNGARIGSGFVRVLRVAGHAPFYTYAVINDQVSSDGSYISPLPAGSLTGRKKLILPVVVETPLFNTEVVLTNYSESAKVLSLAYVADNIQAQANTATTSVVLKPHDQAILPSFVNWMRRHGITGLPLGQSYVGPLFINVQEGDLDGIFVGARTSTVNLGGNYGVFYSAVPSGMTATGSTWLYDFQQNASDRTNLGLVNTGEIDESPDVFKVEIFDGDKGQLVGTVENLAVRSRRLLQISALLDKYAPGTQQGYVRVTRTRGANPFIAFSVINDGAHPGEGSGDGAFVLSQP